MIHYQASPGVPVAACGERGLDLKFSILRKNINCQPCIDRRAAGVDIRNAKFWRGKALKAQRG